MYYCPVHQVAYEKPSQVNGHWLHAHQGEPRPKAETLFVEQVPEGIRIVRAKSPGRTSQAGLVDVPESSTSTPVTTAERPEPVTWGHEDEDEDATKLDQLLLAIGVSPSQRQGIVTGFKLLPKVRENPYYLFSFITPRVSPTNRGQVPWVVDGMFPDGEQESYETPYFHQSPGYGRPAPMFSQGTPPWSHQRSWEMNPYNGGYPPYFGPVERAPAKTEPNPEVVALQKQVDGILGELQTERAERARERQEQQERDRDAVWQAQLNAVSGKVESTFKELGDMVKGLGDQLQRGRGEVETSQMQRLTEEVGTLKDTIASDREAYLQASVDTLHKDLATMQQKLNAEPTGRTTEDLISTGLPLAIGEIRNIGTAVTGELKGIREQAAEGKLPNLTAPNPAKPSGSANPVETAEQIAGVRALEDEILSAAAQPRS